jgi:hypothetical protein
LYQVKAYQSLGFDCAKMGKYLSKDYFSPTAKVLYLYALNHSLQAQLSTTSLAAAPAPSRLIAKLMAAQPNFLSRQKATPAHRDSPLRRAERKLALMPLTYQGHISSTTASCQPDPSSGSPCHSPSSIAGISPIYEDKCQPDQQHNHCPIG